LGSLAMASVVSAAAFISIRCLGASDTIRTCDLCLRRGTLSDRLK
jgi:hypothetical protein